MEIHEHIKKGNNKCNSKISIKLGKQLMKEFLTRKLVTALKSGIDRQSGIKG